MNDDRRPPLRVTYPEELPISARRAELAEVIAGNQVVVVAGETGSGKSTQLPKICLELGRGGEAMIGHTQPRRIAARSVAERVASELGVEVGDEVGYAVRFTDEVSSSTRLKVMTDGILLNELQRDRTLSAYDTIIVDEAHERSLNIDFLLGYLSRLLPERPDLKVIVTSATIDTARFSEHFDDAPVIEVSGRTFPVEVRYRPGDDGEPPQDTVTAVCDAVEELRRHGPGDVLVFASGEREIRDICDGLEGLRLAGTEIVPLFARLSAAEQHRVFAPHADRRIVVATNIAETSITVPGIHYVVDPGTARISRYNKRTRVQRLPIEPVSRASADQRAGRCGRIAPGVCIRLYGEDDYLAREEFTEPEILRTNLASVILQMAALGLGSVEDFPFVEPPDRRQVSDGITLLEDLGALRITAADRPDQRSPGQRLTKLGRRLARLPVDPTLGRMILEAARYGCVHEVMVIAAGLSIQDPRERPTGQEQEAAELHARFRVPGSDFLAYVALWDHVRDRQRTLSSGRFRRECREEFLHFVRIREWQDVYTQLRSIVRRLRLDINRAPASADDIHRAMLAGLIGNVGHRDDSRDERPGRGGRRPGPPPPVEYAGVRGARFSLGRSSSLSRRPPEWVMAAELVETTRLWASSAATVQPSWIEHTARHLVTRRYDSPTWNTDRGSAQVIERVQLRALALVEGRTVDLGGVDPSMARELFILHALVRDEWDTHHRFVTRNRDRIAEVRALEDRARRRDILVEEDAVFAFFDARVPPDVTDVRRFDRWWRDAGTETPDLLDLSVDDLIAPEVDTIDVEAFPTTWQVGSDDAGGAVGGDARATGGRVVGDIDYRFEPGHGVDGATFEIPLPLLADIDAAPFDWLVPGLRTELVTAHLRALPKDVRRQLVPVPDTASEIADTIHPDDGPFRTVLAAAVSARIVGSVDPSVWADIDLAPHLRPRYRVITGGESLAEGPDLEDLERRLRPRIRAALVAAAGDVECDGLADWPQGGVRREVLAPTSDGDLRGYPALVDLPSGLGVRILATRALQHHLHWNGVRALLGRRLPRPARLLQRHLDAGRMLTLAQSPHGSITAVAEDVRDGVIDDLLLAHGPLPFETEAFERLAAAVDARAATAMVEVAGIVVEVFSRTADLRHRLERAPVPEHSVPVADIEAQLDRLVFDGFVVAHGIDRVRHLPRYLTAIAVRLDRLRDGVAADSRRQVEVNRLERAHADTVAAHGVSAATDDIRWMIEEFRVQVFAQQLGTAQPVSDKRIRERLRAVEAAALRAG